MEILSKERFTLKTPRMTNADINQWNNCKLLIILADSGGQERIYRTVN